MKRTLLFPILPVILSGALFFAQEGPSPVFKGPYFGQTPPGAVPQRFAPGFISTAGYDMTPTFSPALDEVFFGRRPTEGGSDNRLYYSKMENGRWRSPALAPFASAAMEFEPQFSVDGDTLFFNRSRKNCYSRRTATGWSEARVMDAPVDEGMCMAAARSGDLYFTGGKSMATYGIQRSRCVDGRYQAAELVIPMASHPWVSPDESYLLFDMYDLAAGARASRLYVSFRRQDGSWSDPVALGNEVNATGTELIAKVSPDGKYLFFQRRVEDNTDVYWVDAGVIAKAK